MNYKLNDYLKKRYVWLGITAVITGLLSHFKIIDLVTAMYLVGVVLGWGWGYDYHKEKVELFFERIRCSCDCPDDSDDCGESCNDEEQ